VRLHWANSFKVEPIFAFPFEASEAASSKRCVGNIKCAFLEIINFDLRSKLNLAKPSTSLLKQQGLLQLHFLLCLRYCREKFQMG
jgi:hypothetical protein